VAELNLSATVQYQKQKLRLPNRSSAHQIGFQEMAESSHSQFPYLNGGWDYLLNKKFKALAEDVTKR